MAVKISNHPTVCDFASDALALALQFERSTVEFYQYEVRTVFESADRTLFGFTVRVMDLDGFGVGSLEYTQDIPAVA